MWVIAGKFHGTFAGVNPESACEKTAAATSRSRGSIGGRMDDFRDIVFQGLTPVNRTTATSVPWTTAAV